MEAEQPNDENEASNEESLLSLSRSRPVFETFSETFPETYYWMDEHRWTARIYTWYGCRHAREQGSSDDKNEVYKKKWRTPAA